MAKIKLGNAPENFKRTVTFPLLDGTEGQIECVFKYRTRTQFGALVDSLSKDAGEPLKNGQFSMETLMEKTRDKNGEYLIEVLEEWKWKLYEATWTFLDAASLPYPDGFFDAIVTSPTYGNRMADHHNALS